MASVLIKKDRAPSFNGCLNGLRGYNPYPDLQYTYCTQDPNQWRKWCQAGFDVMEDMATAVPGFVEDLGQECYEKSLQSFLDLKPTFFTSMHDPATMSRRTAHFGIMVPRWVGEAMGDSIFDIYEQFIGIGCRPYMAMLLSYCLGGDRYSYGGPTSWGDQSPFNQKHSSRGFAEAIKRLAGYLEDDEGGTLRSGVGYWKRESPIPTPLNWPNIHEAKPFATTYTANATELLSGTSTLENTPVTLELARLWNNKLQKAMKLQVQGYVPVLV